MSDVKIDLRDWLKDGPQGGLQVQMGQITDSRLYMNVYGRRAPGVAVVDLDTGKLVYEGEVARKDGLKLSNIIFDGLSVK
ncbi:hypothetical protein [Paenibacillus sp. P36]|uniref:hypothetical protein n=1 Tax=Paenibacillus sp. P36 TaxID=3342538 RepID=UPI0038B3058E